MASGLRVDLHLYNEATGWSITSECMNGRRENPISPEGFPIPDAEWEAEIRRGTMIPIELCQDDPFNVRVIVNEPLTQQEESEWVDRLDWKLCVPDGRLVVAGGAEHLMFGYSDYMHEYMQIVDVPPGDYLVEVYTTIHSVNADMPRGIADAEEWWKKTRKDEPLPAWLLPRDEDDPDRQVPIDFVIRMTPLAAEPPLPPMEGGWFPIIHKPRLPKKCPLGLLSRNVKGLTDKPKYVQTGLEYRHGVYKLVEDLKPAPIDGGPVTIPLPELELPYWIAWFCGQTHPEVRISNAPGFDPGWPDFKEYLDATRRDDGWLIEIEGSNARFRQFRDLKRIAGLLVGLPDGAKLELGTADRARHEVEDSHEGPMELGVHVYSGTVRRGQWSIDVSDPPFDHAAMLQMFDLARQCKAAGGIRWKDARERKELFPLIKADDLSFMKEFESTAELLTLEGGDEFDYRFLGAWFFWYRWRDVLPVREMRNLDEDDDDDE